MLNHQTQSLFRGELIKLAMPKVEEAEHISEWQESSEYLRNLDTDFAVPESLDSIRSHLQKGSRSEHGVYFHIRTLEDDIFIGFVALHSIEWNNQAGVLSIGIGNPMYRGKGYGTDTLRTILRYAFYELNLNRVGLDVIGYNHQAIQAYKKVGFKEEGRLRQAVWRDGVASDRVLMGLLKEEWQQQ